MTVFTTVPDRSAGDVFTEAMWDTYIKDNLNGGVKVKLAEFNLSSAAASFDFTSIPQTFRHLMLITNMHTATVTTAESSLVRFNNDTGANYDRQVVFSTAASTSAGETLGGTSVQAGWTPAASVSSSYFGAMVIYIPDYRNTVNEKIFTVQYTAKTATSSGGLQISATAGVWRSTSPVNQITVFHAGGNIVSGSCAQLYGMP